MARIAGAARGPVVVFGDLPPLARDLDVLVADDDLVAVESALRAHGFVGHGHAWVWFHGGEATAVDVFPASSWQLPGDELAALFTDAEPVAELPDGVVRPSAHHRVLLLARRLHWGGAIDERRRQRLDDALSSADGVADRARRHAPAWRLTQPLDALLSGVTEPREPPGEARGWRPRPRPVVVALSGVDGSGKSSLAEGLVRVLDGLRVPTAMVWARLEWSTLHESRLLAWIAAPVKAVLGFLGRGGGAGRARDDAASTSEDPAAWMPTASSTPRDDAAARLRERSALVTTVWTAIVALLQAREQWRAVRSAGGARVVVCDRYTLDSIVHLRRVYRPDRRLPFADWLLVTLSPRADVALFLDVPPEVAVARKPDFFDVPELAEHTALYLDACRRAGVRRIDATRPAAELLDEVAREAWLLHASRTATTTR